jgi:hypothetical protein
LLLCSFLAIAIALLAAFIDDCDPSTAINIFENALILPDNRDRSNYYIISTGKYLNLNIMEECG